MPTAAGLDGACAQLRVGSYVVARVGRKSSGGMGVSGIDESGRSTGQRIARILSRSFGCCPDRTRHESQALQVAGKQPPLERRLERPQCRHIAHLNDSLNTLRFFMAQLRTLPVLLTADEAADLLRTTRRAIYAMVERRQLPGVVKLRRRVLLRADDLLHWLDQKCAPSPEE